MLVPLYRRRAESRLSASAVCDFDETCEGLSGSRSRALFICSSRLRTLTISWWLRATVPLGMSSIIIHISSVS